MEFLDQSAAIGGKQGNEHRAGEQPGEDPRAQADSETKSANELEPRDEGRVRSGEWDSEAGEEPGHFVEMLNLPVPINVKTDSHHQTREQWREKCQRRRDFEPQDCQTPDGCEHRYSISAGTHANISRGTSRRMKTLVSLLVIGCPALLAQKQEVCKVTQPTASYTIHFLNGSPELNTDPKSPLWSSAARATILKDCTHVLEYPALNSTVRGFWTDKDLFLLFECPYEVLNLWLPPMGGGPRVNLWDRDVVEMFLGDDWKSIRHYREFEIAPTGDWIDLAIDLDKKSYDHSWRSGWKTAARIDKEAKIWYA